MKTKILSALVMLSVGAYFFLGFSLNRPRSLAKERIRHADHAKLLSACRAVLMQKHSFVTDSPTPEWQDDHITITRGSVQYKEKLPPEIREVKPSAVLIFTNQVVLFYCASPIRYVVRAFEEGAKQYGTRQLIDGLCEATNLNEKELK